MTDALSQGGIIDGVRFIDCVRRTIRLTSRATGGGPGVDSCRDLYRRNGQPWRRESRGSPIVLRRPPGAVTRRRLPRYRREPLLRDGDWVGRVGPALWPTAARRTASFSGNQG